MIRIVIVDQGYIDRGDREEAASCPVALAAYDGLGQFVTVFLEFIYLKHGKTFYRYDVGENLTSWISRFDDGQEVEQICVEFDDEKFVAEIAA